MMPCPLPIFSQSDSLIQAVDINSHTEWQTVQIQISWLLKKPTGSALIWICTVCKGRVYPGSAGQGLNYFQNHLPSRKVTWNIKPYLLWKIKKTKKKILKYVCSKQQCFLQISQICHKVQDSTCRSLQKQAYSNTLKILPPKKWQFFR